MKLKLFASLAIVAMTVTACDDSTDTIGDSLTSTTNLFDISTDTFNISTRSLAVDSVLSRSMYSYLGRIKDTETGTYLTSHYTTQFSLLEDLLSNSTTAFPSKDSIRSYNNLGEIVADSCIMRIYANSFLGDSLQPMRLTAYELQKPVEENTAYYSNYDPEKEGLVRTDGLKKSKVYSSLDLNLNDSSRYNIVNKSSMASIAIPMNEAYTKDGKTYNNFGSYLMQTYYQHPEYFANSYSFTHNVCPGFYIKSTGGLGVMTEVYFTDLYVYFKYLYNDSVEVGRTLFTGDEEVMQTTKIDNDKQAMARLAADETCTYLKTPAGIFTEVTLPVDEIMNGHENDSLSSAKVVFTRLNSKDSDSNIDAPSSLLILPKDSLYSFFENKDLPDSRLSFTTTLNSSYNTYTFSNIASMITTLYKMKKAGTVSADWNKVVLVPVTITTTTSSSSSGTTTSDVSNAMSITSTRLVGGSRNTRNPLTISVIYTKPKR